MKRISTLLIIFIAAGILMGCQDDAVTPVEPPAFSPPRMITIPAGSFRMGDVSGTSGYSTDKPVHDVVISRPFLMSETEVTQKLYVGVMGANPSRFSGDSLPVEQISWEMAVRFCNALSQKQGLDTCYSGSGYLTKCDFETDGYRLPTEAEWEYACRAGTETDFYSGKMTQPGSTVTDPALSRVAWYHLNSDHHSHAVGRKEPNAFGLYDMHGNVFEWCWDGFKSDYYSHSPLKDPRGPDSHAGGSLRGGGWGALASGCTSFNRYGVARFQIDNNFGFRVVRSQ